MLAYYIKVKKKEKIVFLSRCNFFLCSQAPEKQYDGMSSFLDGAILGPTGRTEKKKNWSHLSGWEQDGKIWWDQERMPATVTADGIAVQS